MDRRLSVKWQFGFSVLARIKGVALPFVSRSNKLPEQRT